MATAYFTSATQTIRYKSNDRQVEASLLPSVDGSLIFSALVDGIMATTRQPGQYRALQAACKKAGIRAVGKCETLRRNLHETTVRAERTASAKAKLLRDAQRRTNATQADVSAMFAQAQPVLRPVPATPSAVPLTDAEMADALGCCDDGYTPCEPDTTPCEPYTPALAEGSAVQTQSRRSGMIDYTKLTVTELRRLCAQYGIKWRNAHGKNKHMRKAEMVSALAW